MAGVSTHRAILARLPAAPIALAFSLGALAVARRPGRLTTYAGHSGPYATLTLAAGLVLVLAGLVDSSVWRARRIGDLALLAGFTWFAPVWVGWQVGPPPVRTLGMLVAGLTFPLIFHLVLASPGGRLRSRAGRGLVWAVYAEAFLAGVGLALVRDPYLDPNCWANCTDNVFLLRSLPDVAEAIQVTDRWWGVGAAVTMAVISVRRLLGKSGPTRPADIPIAIPAILLAVATVAHAVAIQHKPLEDPSDPTLLRTFEIESVAVILFAAGLLWTASRAVVQRRAVARIVTSLGEAPPPGTLGSALAQALRDSKLRIAYWLPDTTRYVDANGRSVAEPAIEPGRINTALVEDDRRIAIVSHAATLPELQREIGAAVRLGLENERLQAQLLGQLDDLRASRTRIVETGDAEWRRLERDLHDGAQQQLLALCYDIRLAHASAEADADETAQSLLHKAIEEAAACLADLRELAHGIYPATLTASGLAPALATLADLAPIPVQIKNPDERRYPTAVEIGAYLLVAEALDDATSRGAEYVQVAVVHRAGSLIVSVEDDGSRRTSTMVHIADRVGALGGTLRIEATRIGAEFPCA
jgi:signal transduction histidine kinase